MPLAIRSESGRSPRSRRSDPVEIGSDYPANPHQPVHHLVVLHRCYLELVLHRQKTVELRCSLHKRAPFERVSPGDVLWFKLASGSVYGRATVTKTRFVTRSRGRFALDSLGPSRADIGPLGVDFVRRLRRSRFITLVGFGPLTRFEPFEISKRNRLAWVILTKPPREPNARVSPSLSIPEQHPESEWVRVSTPSSVEIIQPYHTRVKSR